MILYVTENNYFAIERPFKIKMMNALVLLYFYFIILKILANIKIIRVQVKFS